MKTETTLQALDTERLEQISTFALIIGVLAVFQSGISWLYWLGLMLLIVGTVGTFAGQLLTKSHVPRIVERMAVVGMMVGILGMLQSWHIWLYENGFYVLGISTLAFIIVSHVESPSEVNQ
jgi:Na+/proline symporter